MQENHLLNESDTGLQNLYLQLFSNVYNEQTLVATSNKNVEPLKNAYQSVRNLAISNRFFYKHYNHPGLIKSLILNVIKAYGIFFEENKEHNIFQGLDKDLIRLKQFLMILLNFDPRKTFFYSKEFLISHLNSITSLSYKAYFKNPVLNLLQVSCLLRILPITKNTKKLLQNSIQAGCINARLLLHALNPYLHDNEDVEIRYPDKKYLSNVQSNDIKLNWYKLLCETLTPFNIIVPPFTDPTFQSSFSHAYRYSTSWLMCLALDFNSTTKILNLLQRTIIPVSELKLFTLIQSSHPQFFLDTVIKTHPDFLLTSSARFLNLLTSDLGRNVYKLCLTTQKKTLIPTQQTDKSFKKLYEPEQLLTVYRKIPKFLNKLSVINAIPRHTVLKLLSHESVDVSRWHPNALYDFLIKSTTAVSEKEIAEISKLPYILTYFNTPDEIQKFISSPEFCALTAGRTGNLVFEKLGINIFQAYKTLVLIDTTKSETSFLSENIPTYMKITLLQLLSNLAEPMLTYLFNRFSNKIKEMADFIGENIAFKKLITSNKRDLLFKWVSKIDLLLSLDNLQLGSQGSVLDFLMCSPQFKEISERFPCALSIINAYHSNVLMFVKRNTDLLKFESKQLKDLHQFKIDHDTSVLTILATANLKILEWICHLQTATIIELTKSGVLQLLINWCFILKDLKPENDELFKSFIVLNEIKFDEFNSIFQFLLSFQMQHAFTPLINHLRTKMNDKSIFLDRDFLRAISQSDQLHPLILKFNVEDWYKLYLCMGSSVEKTNLFTYLTHPCNTIYWQEVVNTFGDIDKICKTPSEVISFVEHHPSKKSFFGQENSELILTKIERERKLLSIQPTNEKTRKHQLKAEQSCAKRQKIEMTDNNIMDVADTNHRYGNLLQQFGLLSRHYRSLSPEEQTNTLYRIKGELKSFTSTLTSQVASPISDPFPDTDVFDYSTDHYFT